MNIRPSTLSQGGAGSLYARPLFTDSLTLSQRAQGQAPGPDEGGDS